MSNPLFELRYATRVLELQARFWRKLDALIKFCSILSSTAAFGAIVSSHPRLTLTFGVVFAILQAIEFTLSPSSRALEAKESGRLYKTVIRQKIANACRGAGARSSVRGDTNTLGRPIEQLRSPRRDAHPSGGRGCMDASRRAETILAWPNHKTHLWVSLKIQSSPKCRAREKFRRAAYVFYVSKKVSRQSQSPHCKRRVILDPISLPEENINRILNAAKEAVNSGTHENLYIELAKFTDQQVGYYLIPTAIA